MRNVSGRQPAKIPPTPSEFESWTREGLALVKALQNRVSPEGPDRLEDLDVQAGTGHSYYVPMTERAHVGSASAEGLPWDQARLETLETTAHESAHHIMREAIGLPVLFAGFGPGRVGEGLGQVVAGLALALEGKTPEDRAYGARVLDPSWQVTPIGEFKKRDVPLSTTTADLESGEVGWWEDGGGVHVHGGIVMNAHRKMAAEMGIEAMGRVTLEAMEGLTLFSGIKAWAELTVETAARLHGADSEKTRIVSEAWRSVGVEL